MTPTEQANWKKFQVDVLASMPREQGMKVILRFLNFHKGVIRSLERNYDKKLRDLEFSLRKAGKKKPSVI